MRTDEIPTQKTLTGSFCAKHNTRPEGNDPCWQCIVEHIPAVADQEKRADESMLECDSAQRELAAVTASLNALTLANEAKRQEVVRLRTALREVTGSLAEDVAHHCDHYGIDGSKWWKAVKRARRLLDGVVTETAKNRVTTSARDCGGGDRKRQSVEAVAESDTASGSPKEEELNSPKVMSEITAILEGKEQEPKALDLPGGV